MGSDAIYTGFGENTRELGWFVKAGMTPEQALRTATTNAAAVLDGKEERIPAQWRQDYVGGFGGRGGRSARRILSVAVSRR